MRDITLGDTVDFKFTSRRFSTGAPFTLAGSPAVAAYVGNGTTEVTSGITLTTDFDSRTGLNNVRVVATSGNGFASGTDVALVITSGTVDSVSVVGEVVAEFTIGRSAAHKILADPTSGLVETYNLVNSLDADSTLSDATKKDIADKLLGRDQEGGADGGRTVSQALMRMRNRATLSGAAGDTTRTFTVFENDGTTTLFQATVTFDAGGNITSFAPTS